MAELSFEDAYSAIAKQLGLNPNPDDPRHFYDYRAAFQKYGPGFGVQEGHFPSEFKLEGHPRMVVDGINTKTGQVLNPDPLGLFGSAESAQMQMTDPKWLQSLMDAYSRQGARNAQFLDSITGGAFTPVSQFTTALAETPGVDYITTPLGMIAPLGRSKAEIATLRKIMAAEQRTRGPMAEEGLEQIVDRISRGGWFHGANEMARENLLRNVKSPLVQPQGLRHSMGYNMPDFMQMMHGQGMGQEIVEDFAKLGTDVPMVGNALLKRAGIKLPKGAVPRAELIRRAAAQRLQQQDFTGLADIYAQYDIARKSAAQKAGLVRGALPISHHTMRIGEPAGISLSAKGNVAGGFAEGSLPYRVFPLFEGPPTERVIPAFAREGRPILDAAYDEALNKIALQMRPSDFVLKNPIATMDDVVREGLRTHTRQFNAMMRENLLGQGKRGILYSPERYGEYEMLWLDPLNLLPLDYRMGHHFPMMNIGPNTKMLQGGATPMAELAYGELPYAGVEMYQHLGDIYEQTPIWNRLLTPQRKHIIDVLGGQDAHWVQTLMEQQQKLAGPQWTVPPKNAPKFNIKDEGIWYLGD